jgi:TonB family protein
LSLSLIFSMAASPSAAPPAPARLLVSWKDFGCVVEVRGAKPMRFGLFWGVGDRHLEMFWRDDGASFRSRPSKFDFFAEPGHVRLGTAIFRSNPLPHGYWASELDLSFLDRLEGSTAMSVEAKGKRPVEVPMSDAGAAIAELRSCNDSALRRFGVDPAALAALRQLPKSLAGGASAWIRPKDYPKRALRERRVGVSLALLTVGTDGRVVDCTIVRASGSQDLDAAACILLKDRGRFEPAVGPDGMAASAPIFVTAIWRIG